MKIFIKLVNLLGAILFWITKFQMLLVTPTALLTERVTIWLIDLEDKYNGR